ncbi:MULTISPECIES: YqeG family HAD IIIA-type phosphatase [unclassified Mycoplasma]|uniref:YqeG family HAD IIIA-type phosphatase n=1 Tax=unclassified Mycoplasma TaxID=2683645 RepID=UPI000FDF2DD4
MMDSRRKKLIANYFKPSIYIRSFKDVNLTQLKRQGIRLFISDLDNTLVPHYTRLPNADVINFIQKIQSAGIIFVIVSNNTKNRTQRFAEKTTADAFYGNARKPFKRVVRSIIERYQVLPSETIIMGDQIVMDILVANRLKCESILVQPLVSTDYKMNWFHMFLERVIYSRLAKRNILVKGQFTSSDLSDRLELL